MAKRAEGYDAEVRPFLDTIRGKAKLKGSEMFRHILKLPSVILNSDSGMG